MAETLSRFGQAFLRSLEQNRPEEYARLKAGGDLDSLAAQVDARAQSQYEHLVAELQRTNPLPTEYAARASALMALQSQAEELVMDEVLVKDAETEQAETEGYR